ncbi:MAG: hypothetical protein U9Q03_04285 [Patescibacteria group bacterium]|nr:hypothetical protein [Patescibacteria group bacterium]
MLPNAVLKSLAKARNTGDVDLLFEVMKTMNDYALDPEDFNLDQRTLSGRIVEVCLASCAREMKRPFPDILKISLALTIAIDYGLDADRADDIRKEADRQNDIEEMGLPSPHMPRPNDRDSFPLHI